MRSYCNASLTSRKSKLGFIQGVASFCSFYLRMYSAKPRGEENIRAAAIKPGVAALAVLFDRQQCRRLADEAGAIDDALGRLGQFQ